MHGEDDAFHMFKLHTKLVHNKEMLWSELEGMIPLEKEAFINFLLAAIKEETAAVSKPDLNLIKE